MKSLWAKLYIKILCAFFFVGLAFVGFMGFAHTKAGRPALMWVARMTNTPGLCPLGYDRPISREEREARRSALAVSHLHQPVAPSSQILDFTLGRSNKAGIKAWAKQNGGTCLTLKSDYDIQCDGKFFSSQQSTFWFEFDAQNILVAVRGVESFATAQQALDLYHQARAGLVMKNHSRVDELNIKSPRALQAALLRQASVSGDFQNLRGTVRVTNLGEKFTVSQDIAAF
jgi:hypothetical protein